MYIVNSQQINEAEKLMRDEYALPSLLLMETAGRKSADAILNYYPDIHNFMILCGSGNNGGDGMVIARYLHKAGRIVNILFSKELDSRFLKFQTLKPSIR